MVRQNPDMVRQNFLLPQIRVIKNRFFRTWFATSTDLRATNDSDAIKWGIHWYTPVSIVLLLILGITSAVSHHVFYSKLHSTVAGDDYRQRWVSWIGTSMGFLTKVCFTAVVGISRTQWVWVTLRERRMTIGGIDALFGVSSDPTFFTNFNMLRHAKFATVMAVMMWMTPLTAILTPGTLSVITIGYSETAPCIVRSIVFPFDSNSTAKLLSNSHFGQGMQVESTGQWLNKPQALRQFLLADTVVRALTWAAYTDNIARPLPFPQSIDPPRHDITLPEVCDDICSYSLQFLGPAITCTDATWGEPNSSWSSAHDFMGEFDYRAEIPEDGLLLAGVRRPSNNDVVIPDNYTIVMCRPSIARYTVRQDIKNGLFAEPWIDKVEQTQSTVPPPTYPTTTYLSNRLIFNNQAQTLRGNVTYGQLTASDVIYTTLYDEILKRPITIGHLLERMSNRMVVSLFSFDLTAPDENRIILDVTAVEETICTKLKPETIYHYSAKTLVALYSISIAVALGMALAGFVALERNGVASNKSISAIIRTTRNPTLDTRIGGSCLGGDPMPEELKNLELQFGVLKRKGASTAQRISPFALGIPAEIDPIQNGGQYS